MGPQFRALPISRRGSLLLGLMGLYGAAGSRCVKAYEAYQMKHRTWLFNVPCSRDTGSCHLAGCLRSLYCHSIEMAIDE